MTTLAAANVGIANRGALKVGHFADLVLFDPATIADAATYAEPFQYPLGITAVLVNGAVALRDGQRAPARTGRALRVKT